MVLSCPILSNTSLLTSAFILHLHPPASQAPQNPAARAGGVALQIAVGCGDRGSSLRIRLVQWTGTGMNRVRTYIPRTALGLNKVRTYIRRPARQRASILPSGHPSLLYFFFRSAGALLFVCRRGLRVLFRCPSPSCHCLRPAVSRVAPCIVNRPVRWRPTTRCSGSVPERVSRFSLPGPAVALL
jgi:hypothetical protein